MAASGAGRLFAERARAVRPAFELSDANAPAAAQVCRRLDGIPLALELAAARVRVLTPEQLAARLDDRFALLTGGGRTAVRRQQTLRATVDWSHALLTEPERALFRRLAVFAGGAAGGFPLEAAEAVGAGEPVAAAEVLDLLAGLVDKSLVLAEARGAEERYRLLETLRQYAEERLLQAGEAAAVRGRHAAWCLGLGRAIAAAEAAGTLPRLNPARGRLDGELESVRAALGWWASDPAAAPAGLELLAAVGQGGVGETASESRRWLETFLRMVPARTAARAQCLLALDHFLRWEHEFPRALAAAREARGIFEELGEEDGAAEAAGHEGLVAANLGDYDRGAALLGACLARARARRLGQRRAARARPGGGRPRAAGLRRGPGAHRGEPRGGPAPQRRGPSRHGPPAPGRPRPPRGRPAPRPRASGGGPPARRLAPGGGGSRGGLVAGPAGAGAGQPGPGRGALRRGADSDPRRAAAPPPARRGWPAALRG